MELENGVASHRDHDSAGVGTSGFHDFRVSYLWGIHDLICFYTYF